MNENRKRGINENTNNATLLLIAIICAVAAWFIVAMTIYPSESKTITDIPLIMDITGTSAAENGLSVTNRNVEKVTVSFDCSRTNYNRINADDIRAYVNFDNITTEGKKTLTIQVDSDSHQMQNSFDHPYEALFSLTFCSLIWYNVFANAKELII